MCAKLGPELRHAVVADGVDDVVREALGGDVEHGHVGEQVQDLVADRMEQMCLAEAHAPVDEEGVVGLGGELGHGLARGLGELVGRADHEGVERVPGGQAAGAGCRRVRAGGRGARRRPTRVGIASILTRGLPPSTSRAAACRAARWCWSSHSRMKPLGALSRRWSPSRAATRQGRTQESMTLSGRRGSRAWMKRSQSESSTGGSPSGGRTGTYTQAYPQGWITRNLSLQKRFSLRDAAHPIVIPPPRMMPATIAATTRAAPVAGSDSSHRNSARRVGLRKVTQAENWPQGLCPP